MPLVMMAGTVCFAGSGSSAPQKNLLAGAAKVMITPATPIPMSGYGGRKGPFKGVHDDLYLRVVVFSDGENKAAVISAELIGLSNAFWEEVTQKIETETGIKKDYILLTSIHTHSGPTTTVYGEDNSPEVLAYVEDLKSKIVTATRDAMKKMVPASIGAGKGECKMNTNRRAMDGKGGISLGVNPYAPCDHEVGVIRVDDKAGNTMALLMNWPCHAVVLGPKNYQITSDWPGAAAKYAETGIGGNVVAPVIVGASGDINPVYGPHIDFETNSSYAYGKDAIGEDLANVSMAVMKDIKTSSVGRISAAQRVISLPAKERDNSKGLQPERKDDGTLKVRLSVLRIGSVILTGVSGEVFNQISVKMRNQSPYTNTFMISHCNGSSGYLVTDDSYPVTGKSGYADKTTPKGGYEPGSTRAKSGAEAGIINNLLEMINEL
jgi:hypothetical protein